MHKNRIGIMIKYNKIKRNMHLSKARIGTDSVMLH